MHFGAATLSDVLNVIWAKKSLVYNSRFLSSGAYKNKYKFRSRRALTYGDIPVPRLTDPQLSCPWDELEKLTLQLQTSVSEPLVQPDLQRCFQQAGFGRLIEVKVERLGKCAEQPKPFVTDAESIYRKFYDVMVDYLVFFFLFTHLAGIHKVPFV
ncbi:hypothetical protein ACTXT7_000696 [Hymenolepis weldensis]